MRKKVFNMILIFAIIIGILSAGSVYAANVITNPTTSTNITNSSKNNSLNTSAETISVEEPNNQTVPTSEQSTTTENDGLSNHDIGLLAAALATGLACIGAGIAVAMVASSAIGAISENPSLLGKTIIFAGLAEGIAIYGLIISIMILNKI